MLKRRRDRLRAALFAALQEQARDFLDEQRHAAGALAHPIDGFPRQCVALGEFADHLPHLGAIEQRERDRAVMRARAPRRVKFRARCRHDEQRRQRAAFGEAAQYIERGRIGPMQVLEREHDRLRARTRREPGENRRHLPAAQLLRRQRRGALWRKRDVDKRRQQRHIFRGVELDLAQ